MKWYWPSIILAAVLIVTHGVAAALLSDSQIAIGDITAANVRVNSEPRSRSLDIHLNLALHSQRLPQVPVAIGGFVLLQISQGNPSNIGGDGTRTSNLLIATASLSTALGFVAWSIALRKPSSSAIASEQDH